jgi:hypothetical protein
MSLRNPNVNFGPFFSKEVLILNELRFVLGPLFKQEQLVGSLSIQLGIKTWNHIVHQLIWILQFSRDVILGFSKSFFSINHCSNSIDHVLDQLFFRSSKSSSVWDIKDGIIRLNAFYMNSSCLNVILVSYCLELFFVRR